MDQTERVVVTTGTYTLNIRVSPKLSADVVATATHGEMYTVFDSDDSAQFRDGHYWRQIAAGPHVGRWIAEWHQPTGARYLRRLKTEPVHEEQIDKIIELSA